MTDQAKADAATIPDAVLTWLTPKQVEVLQPLFDYASRQADAGRKGIIFAQPAQENEMVAARMMVGFIEVPFAKTMQECVNEARKHKSASVYKFDSIPSNSSKH